MCGSGFSPHGAGAVFGGIGEAFVEALPPAGTGLVAATVHLETFLDLTALLGGLGFDAIDFVADIDAIGDGALGIVFHYQVLVAEPDGLFRRRGGEADEKGVELFQHLPPEAVDGAVAFVGDSEIEGFDGDGRIVGDCLRRPSAALIS